MKKLLSTVLVLGLLGGGGYLVYKRFLAPKEVRACQKLAELCGDLAKDQLQSCEQKMGELEKAVGKEAMEKAVSCIGEAKSCTKGVGCMVGAGISGLGEFLEGVRRSVQGK